MSDGARMRDPARQYSTVRNFIICACVVARGDLLSGRMCTSIRCGVLYNSQSKDLILKVIFAYVVSRGDVIMPPMNTNFLLFALIFSAMHNRRIEYVCRSIVSRVNTLIGRSYLFPTSSLWVG